MCSTRFRTLASRLFASTFRDARFVGTDKVTNLSYVSIAAQAALGSLTYSVSTAIMSMVIVRWLWPTPCTINLDAAGGRTGS